jgi:hypothetical protein
LRWSITVEGLASEADDGVFDRGSVTLWLDRPTWRTTR